MLLAVVEQGEGRWKKGKNVHIPDKTNPPPTLQHPVKRHARCFSAHAHMDFRPLSMSGFHPCLRCAITSATILTPKLTSYGLCCEIAPKLTSFGLCCTRSRRRNRPR